MAQRKVWLSWVVQASTQADPNASLAALKKNGLAPQGNHWIDDIAKAAWAELLPTLSDAQQNDAWIIALDRASFERVSVRYGLSVLAATLRERRGMSYPIVVLGIDFTPMQEQLPAFLRTGPVYTAADSGWPAKLVASFFKKSAPAAQEFRFSVYASQYTGQWFEIGPAADVWNGVMFGVSGEAKITHHAVGPKGALPERTVLEYATKDIKAKVGETEFTVWSVQNQVNTEQSYFLKVEGASTQVVFGGHPGAENAEVYRISLS
ncbi:MAG: hypothetical protein HY273_01810 [Gammaproteobacteria bacterium]|nr:hypothetical protein [Gammaproteobacteria bacterium]